MAYLKKAVIRCVGCGKLLEVQDVTEEQAEELKNEPPGFVCPECAEKKNR